MEDLPEKTCEIDRLVTHKGLVRAAREGRKTQQRRDGVYAHPGERFDLEGDVFEVTRLFRQRLGDVTKADARAEGFPDLETYRGLILRMHRGMEWDPDHLVWVHEFEKVAP